MHDPQPPHSAAATDPGAPLLPSAAEDAATEIERLRERVKKMAEERSQLQLIVHLMERLNPLPGLDNMVSAMLSSIMETIGGTNIKLYYWIDAELRYADFLGEQKTLPAIDDSLVARVAESREFVEVGGDSRNGLLIGEVAPGTWTWAFPLPVGQELVGIIKLENLHLRSATLRSYLPFFFSHAALILCNEIRAHTRRQIEAELEQHRNHLEALVKERTEQLEQARNAAEAANRAKSVFLSNMSHELRTPLNAILGFAQLMERSERIPAGERRNLEIINRSGRYLLSLINDVLEISRIEAGRTTIQNETFDLPVLVASVEEMVRVRAVDKGLEFFVQHSGELPRYVYGDALHLRQVLINLLGNAVKYADKGRIRLQLTPIGDHTRFEVCDNGPGIAREDQERIFQPFYQTEAGIAKGEGTGLGLAISREFVRLMGGELNLASEPGKGSVFSFTLPLPEVEAPAQSPQSVESGRVLRLEPSQAPVRVLVAEDNADSRELLVRVMEDVGFQVRSAENGQRAVEIFQNWQPHFIWMDMRMPVLDGYQATRRIRSLPGGAAVKIVALTASAFHENRTAILAAGCDEMLAKPLEAHRVYAVMGELLDLRYQYAADHSATATMAAPAASADGEALPPAVLEDLRQAVDMLDVDAVNSVVQKLLADYPEKARRLAELAGEYRFDAIARMCGDGHCSTRTV